MFFELLNRTGARLEIQPGAHETAEFSPCDFWVESGELWVFSPEFMIPAPHPTLTPETFDLHIERMIREGFRVTLHS